jgi:exonuclease VII small subunit
MTLARFCDAKLKEVQKSVELVLKESGEEWKTVPFETGLSPAEGSDDDDRG